MTHKAFIKQADLRRMAAITKEFGIRVEIEVDGVILRLAPDSPSSVLEEEFTTLEEWKSWRDEKKRRSKQLPDDFAL